MKQFCNFLTVFCVFLCGCGGGPSRQLMSITVTPSSTTAQNGQAQFTATGQFNTSPMTVTPLPVSWMIVPSDPAGPGYVLTDQPFMGICRAPGTATIVAFAPMDPSAASSGSMSFQAFNDLVMNHTTMQEAGFVAATAQLNCP